MKLLGFAAIALPCVVVGLLTWTSFQREEVRHAAAPESSPREQQANRPSAELVGLPEDKHLEDVGPRVEVLEFDWGFDESLPESHWMGDPANEPEFEHPDGPWLKLHDNGVIDEQGAYKNDLEVGAWKWWWENGERKAIGQFEEGKRIGSWTWWHDNGQVLMEGQYEDDEGFGPWRMYHDNGTLWGEGQYEGGEISGFWRFFLEDGRVDEERTGFYVAGVLQTPEFEAEERR